MPNLEYSIMSRTDDPCPRALPIYGGHHHYAAMSIWRARGIDDHLLMLVTAGACRITVHGVRRGSTAAESFRVEQGSLVVIPPRVMHDYGVDATLGQWGVLWLVFQARPQWLPLLQLPVLSGRVGRLTLPAGEIQDTIRTHLDQAQRLATGSLVHRDLLAMNALEAALLWCQQAPQSLRASGADPRINHLREVIARRLAEPLDVPAMARTAGVSQVHLNRLFRQHLGCSPQVYLESTRMERACELLRSTPLAIQDIALEVGFPDPFYFSNRFRRHVGRSPRTYRADAIAS